MIGKVFSVGLLGVGMALGQAPAAAPAKALAFDVVSIRQNTTPMGPQNGPPQFGPTPDGYRMTGMPLALVIMTAYPPQSGNGNMLTPDRISGLPDWAMRDRYDINAKVAEEDIAEWQKSASQTAMLQAMLQAFLKERCKIQVHRDSKESQVYLMTVGKSGPKFKEADPAATHPAGMTLPGGATVVPSGNGIAVYGTTMPMLATLLSSMGKGGMDSGARQIQDKTGLTGKYDLVIPRPDMGPPPGGPGGSAAFDPTEMIFSSVEALGLKLESSKASVETLVIDHIEKPSQN
jgi:bla regulator protein BlaR1